MSVQAALAFRRKVNDDPTLQRKVRDAVKAQGFVDAVALGKAHGFEFTQAEVSQISKDDNLELTEFELEMVSGGTTLIASNVDQGGCEKIVTPTTTISQPTIDQSTIGF